MTLVKFNNNKKANGFAAFNDLLDGFFADNYLTDSPVAKVPAVNITETESHFKIALAAPGLKKEDFKISLEKDFLKISAEVKTENKQENEKISRQEFSYSSFVRSFNLPDLVDYSKIEASYTDGILNISIAKKEEAKIQIREINIQ